MTSKDGCRATFASEDRLPRSTVIPSHLLVPAGVAPVGYVTRGRWTVKDCSPPSAVSCAAASFCRRTRPDGAECSLMVSARLRVVVEERWRDLRDGKHVVSERGRVARLLNVDRSHRYPRVSIGGEKKYLHALVAEAWYGPRPDGAQALHWDDDPDNPNADNIRWGSP